MLVGERMTKRVITVRPDMPIQEALNLMHTEKVRRFPVVEAGGKLVGIVSEKDLLNASPSDVTSLSVFELTYLLSKITVERVMNRNPITITEDTPLEEAARIMADNKISAMPVMRKNELVGIITETDLFKIFLELMGARDAGVRMTLLLSDVPGMLADISKTIQELGGNVISLGTFMGETAQNRLVTIKVEGVPMETLRKSLEPKVERIVDVRETHFA